MYKRISEKLKSKHQIALCGELALEETTDLSSDCLLHGNRSKKCTGVSLFIEWHAYVV